MLMAEEFIYYSASDGSHEGKKDSNLIPFINYHKPAPERCLDMLLDKYYGRKYQSEVIMAAPEPTEIPSLKKALSEAEVLLVTDGGLVPSGNPDQIPFANARSFGIYDIAGKASLKREGYEVCHQGYDAAYVEEDPDRLVPVDAMRELEREHVIGKLHDTFLSTTGVMTPEEESRRIGEQMAAYALRSGADAVVISSVCGTSTRCGAYIAVEMEKAGIPAVQVANLTKIARDAGCSRVVQGNHVCYPFGAPQRPRVSEYLYRKKLARKALCLF